MTEKGTCQHGEFNLFEGCPQCVAERRAQGITPTQDELEDGLNSEGLTLAPSIVKVRYYSETTGELSPREYTYYSEEPLEVGDIVTVPVRDTIGKAKVSAIDVPEAEIEAFKDKVKTIPAGSKCIITTVPPGPFGGVTAIVSPAGHVTILPKTDEVVGVPNRSVPNETEAVIRVNPGACLAPTTAIINIGPEHDPAVVSLSGEAHRLRNIAVSRVIAADTALTPATEDLSVIAKVKKALTEKKNEYLKPIKAHIDAVTSAFDSILIPLNEADLITRNKVKDYRAAAEKRRLEAEEINRQKQELARREAEFNGTGEFTVDVTPVEAPAPVNRVVTGLGTASTMKVTKWELVDLKLVPDDFKTLDSAKITKLVKAGGSIPGIRVWTEESIRVTAR